MSNILLGTAIGDALGVPFETMLINNPALVEWNGINYSGSFYHELLPGQYSDDTQMSLMVAESLIQNSGFNPENLAARYVDWIVSKRARGYGRTTMLAVQNLINGKSWQESGIVGSYGNGTAMRAAPFGVYFRDDLSVLIDSVKKDSAITHVSDDAEAGALTIALATYYAINADTENLLEKICSLLPNCKTKNTLGSLPALLDSNDITSAQALRIIGTKANVQETVPAALYCFLKFNNYEKAVVASIKAGGDTDTTAAIVGALFAAKEGTKNMRPEWIEQVEDREKIIQLDSQLYHGSNVRFF